MSRRNRKKAQPLGRAARVLRRHTSQDWLTSVGHMANHYAACGRSDKLYASRAYFDALNEIGREKLS